MFEPAIVPAINHLLHGASWAPRKLLSFAGRTLQFESALLRVNLRVTAEGLVEPAAEGAASDLHVVLPLPALLRLLAGDRAARRDAIVSGDADFAREVAAIVDELRWDIEEDLSRIVGDIAAHRMVEAGRTAADWQRRALEGAAHNAAEFWVEEDPLIASRPRVQAFIDEVDRLREDVDRLSKRVELLQRQRT